MSRSFSLNIRSHTSHNSTRSLSSSRRHLINHHASFSESSAFHPTHDPTSDISSPPVRPLLLPPGLAPVRPRPCASPTISLRLHRRLSHAALAGPRSSAHRRRRQAAGHARPGGLHHGRRDGRLRRRSRDFQHALRRPERGDGAPACRVRAAGPGADGEL